MGMLIAHVCLWKPLDDLYDYKNCILQEDFSTMIISELKSKKIPLWLVNMI